MTPFWIPFWAGHILQSWNKYYWYVTAMHERSEYCPVVHAFCFQTPCQDPRWIAHRVILHLFITTSSSKVYIFCLEILTAHANAFVFQIFFPSNQCECDHYISESVVVYQIKQVSEILMWGVYILYPLGTELQRHKESVQKRKLRQRQRLSVHSWLQPQGHPSALDKGI